MTKIQSPAGTLFLVASLSAVLVAGVSCGQADRESWQPPDEIMDAVGVATGMRVGEAGAGTGYLTLPLARRVGAQGIVYANDISKSSLDTLRRRAEAEGLENIRIVVGEVEDPVFPETDLDMIVMVYVLHMLEKPVEFMRNVGKYLGPDGRLVIIEKNTKRERAHYPSFMTNKQILETMGETGFELTGTETFLPKDTIYLYKPKR